MGPIQFLYFLIIGAIAGWLAGKMMKGKGFGLLGNLVVGIIGAIIGGFVFTLLHIPAAGPFGALVTALVGAIILLWLLRAVKK